MTALQVIEAVLRHGGQVTLRGEKVNCRVPEVEDDALIRELKQQRDAIARLLRIREEQSLGRDNRCYTHGTHEEWYRHPGAGWDRICAKCHPRV
jgi:hypothetical protein